MRSRLEAGDDAPCGGLRREVGGYIIALTLPSPPGRGYIPAAREWTIGWVANFNARPGKMVIIS